VHAYALLFRGGPEQALREMNEKAAGTMLDHAVVFGYERLTRGLPGFVSCTSELLNSGVVHLLPPKLTVLEIGETTQPTAQLMATCHLLKAAGFRLSFGNFCWERRFGPLMRMADFVKVDCDVLRMAGIEPLKQRAGGHATKWVARNVNTHDDFLRAKGEGFTLFEGFYFCHPEVIKSHAIPANRLSQSRVLVYMHSRALDMHQLSALVMQDAGLSYRLLRLVNSPLYPIRREVGSIEAALMVVGEEAFRRIVTLALVSELNEGGSAELLRLALTRARFCEMAAPLRGLDADEQYLLGMLSLLPAMLKMAMQDVAPALPLRAPIREALLGAANQERQNLSWLEMYERGEWGQVRRLTADSVMDEQQFADMYLGAVLWSEMATECTP